LAVRESIAVVVSVVEAALLQFWLAWWCMTKGWQAICAKPSASVASALARKGLALAVGVFAVREAVDIIIFTVAALAFCPKGAC